jgi:hypothetical protein
VSLCRTEAKHVLYDMFSGAEQAESFALDAVRAGVDIRPETKEVERSPIEASIEPRRTASDAEKSRRVERGGARSAQPPT